MRAWLTWRRVSVAGLSLLAALLVLGSALPDPRALSARDLADLRAERPLAVAVAEFVPLGRILTSPWLLALCAALAAAIAWNVGARVRSRLRPGAPRDASPLRFRARLQWRSSLDAPEALARLAAALRRRLYFVQAAPGGLVARRGALGFWGSIVFHGALVLLCAGVGVSLAGGWRGELLLAEGQDAALDDPASVRVLRRGQFAAPVPHAVVTLSRFAPRWLADRFPLDYRAELVGLDSAGRMRRAEMWVNQPFEVEGQRLYLSRYGVAPTFVVRKGPRTLLGAPVSLTVIGGREDSFEVPGTGLRVGARYFGDPVLRGGRYQSRTDVPRSPAFELRLVDGEGAPRLVRRGEQVDLGPVQVSFSDLRYWVVLGVDRDPGSSLVFAAVILAALGLALRFWDHDREVRVRAEPREAGCALDAGGQCRYFPTLVERELRALGRFT